MVFMVKHSATGYNPVVNCRRVVVEVDRYIIIQDRDRQGWYYEIWRLGPGKSNQIYNYVYVATFLTQEAAEDEVIALMD